MPSPRVTSADSSYGEPETFEHTVFLECLESIVGASRREAAFRWSKHGRKDPLIELDDNNKGKG